ncbi:hypothetical protein CEXT_485731 [Caerostris extrusa]|uniref:Uncharacterized protein n=1 Tax=Caerostris extrusa TaxID=172846 RepID=A0AAV4W1H9_CAEEX|nr:hypothetical protein CEXT_485731 [Caerostris extrusa]
MLGACQFKYETGVIVDAKTKKSTILKKRKLTPPVDAKLHNLKAAKIKTTTDHRILSTFRAQLFSPSLPPAPPPPVSSHTSDVFDFTKLTFQLLIITRSYPIQSQL